jgi:TonB-dependent receptor
MRKLIQKLTPVILLLILVCNGYSTTAIAQSNSGHIKGQITDSDGGPLPGASIVVKGTSRGVTSDLAGNFSLLNVKAGKYVLLTNYMGFKPVEVEVEVKNGETVTTKVQLTVSVTSLQKVTVSAFREGQQKALNQQRNADNIKQVVSADLMGRFPDLNVAEALQRLPGVTIGREQGEGSTVQLRGTPGNFTNININGEQVMGSREEGQRNAQLDLVPANILSSMEVIKTLTPDQDGDAIAGAINLKTPTATSLKSRISLDLGGGFNDLRKKFNGIGNVNYGKRFLKSDQLPNGKLGVALSGSYYKTVNGYDELNAQVWQEKDFGDGKGTILFPTDIRLLYLENERTRKGATATVDYNFTPTTSIVGNVTYTELDNDAIRYRKRTRMQTANTTKTATGPYTTTRGRGYNEIMERTMDNSNINYSLEGETSIKRVKLDAGLFYTKTQLEQEANTFNFITGNIPLTIDNISGDFIQASSTSDWKNNGSLYTYNTIEGNNFNTRGRNLVARLNMTLPYKIGDNAAIFKAGVKTKNMQNDRYRPASTFVANYSGPSADGKLTNFLGAEELSDDLLDGNLNFGRAVNKDATINYFHNNQANFTYSPNLTAVSIETYFYDATENVTSGYLMNRVQFNKLMMLGGLRVERTSVDYEANIVNQDANGNLISSIPSNMSNSYTKFLPNLQTKYDLAKNTLVRGALSFGYSRPNFPELVPSRIVNILGQTLTDGNPELQPAFSTNLDFSLEHYLKNLGILSVGAFYKNIDKFQYNSVVTLTGNEFEGANAYQNWRYFKTYNGNTAKVYGLELNAQANLTFLPGALKGISLYANYTHAYSKADAQLRKGLRLPGQADHTVNGSLSYNYKGFTLQGNLNYNGAYTVSLGANDANDVIRDDRVQLDINTSMRLSKKVTIYAEVVNLTNASQVDYLGDRSRIYTLQYYSFSGRTGVKIRL